MDLFELQATLRLNTTQYNRSLHQAESDGEGFIDRIADKWTSVKSKFQTVANVLGPVVDLVKDAVSNFSEFQQLSGSIETLFGSAAAGVIQKSKEAWRTAGISMNDYLNQVTSVAARMIDELGGNTEEAARLADMAIQDMSDNANTFGSDLSSIQNAYSGFSRGVYTMLDNLKLGYGGTASEMYRLLEDAAKLDEEFANSAVFSMDGNGHLNARYADIVKAINIIQRSKGIQGRSAEESQSTVQGSLTSMKALWENLKTLMATPLEVREGETREEAEARRQHEIQEMAQNMASALEGVLRNIMPVIKQAILGLIQIFTELIPEVVKIIPPLIDGIVRALPEIITALANGLTQLLQNTQLRQGLLDAINTLLDALVAILQDREMWRALIDLVTALVTAIASALPNIAGAVVQFVLGILKDPDIMDQLIKTIIYAITQGLAALLDMVVTGFAGLLSFIPGMEDFTKKGTTAFREWGIYDWIESLFGVGGPVEQARQEQLNAEREKALEEGRETFTHGDKTYWAREDGAVEIPEGMPLHGLQNYVKVFEAQLGRELSYGELNQMIADGFFRGLENSTLNSESINATSDNVTIDGRTVTIGNATFNFNPDTFDNYWNSKGWSRPEGHAKGLWDVPYDNYLANLHRDEMVLTASQARDYREGNGGGLDTDALYAAVSAAVAEAVSNIQVNMDGTLVGNAVAETVSRNIYREAARRY